MSDAPTRARAWIERGTRRRAWAVGLGAALVVGLLYVGVFRPIRPAYTRYVGVPVLSLPETARAGDFETILFRDGFALGIVRRADRSTAAGWTAPPGVLFLLPGLFLAAVFPTRPYWAYLLAYHVGLGFCQLVILATGIGWAEGMFEVYRFSQTYLAETVSLAVPALLFIAGLRSEASGD